MRRVSLVVAAALAIAMAAPSGPALADKPCTGGTPASGGEWARYGRDLAGTRNQPDETQISTDSVANLAFAWRSPASVVNAGNSTAVVAGNCVYVAGTSTGTITALDIGTGALVWRAPSAPSYPGKTSTFAVAVQDGRVYANVSEGDGSQLPEAAPVAVALDADTGESIYESEPIQFGQPTTAVASAVVFGDRQLVVTNGGDGIPTARPGYALLDATTGETLHKQTTIPTRDLDRGYAGGGQWATPVVDVASGYAFNGTANPYSKKVEHRYDNAIIKIDVDPTRSTFGQVVDAYKGNVDQYFPGVDRQPLCDEFGDQIGYHPCCNFSVTCVQFDIDFGASPTMWRNRDGELMVGDLQKSGVFHAVYADTMQHAWTALLSTVPPGTAGNADSAANDGERIYVVANPGILYALSPENGRILWAAPVGDGAEYHPVSVANGVVYVIGNHGMLLAYSASNGTLQFASSVPVGASQVCVPLAGGISIARNTVLVVCDGTLAAYRLKG